MPLGQGPVEATRLSLDKSQQALERVLFMFIRGSVSLEQFQKGSSMHTGAIAPIGNGVKSGAARRVAPLPRAW